MRSSVINTHVFAYILEGSAGCDASQRRQGSNAFPQEISTATVNSKFPLVTIPFRSMQHMFTVEDQAEALMTAATHLTDSGILAFDVFYPKFEMIWSKVGEEIPEMEWVSSA